MHSLLVVAALPLAFASVNLFARDTLLPRQGGDAFKPGTVGTTDSCAPADICGGGDDSPIVCLQRNLGDVCCPENYGCPGGNFCLIKGFCCPDGDDPATCALQNGVTLPAGFTPGSAVASSAPPASSSAASQASSASAPAVVVTPSSTATSTAVSIPSASGNSTITPPKPSVTGSAPATFTGGSSALYAGLSTGVLGVVLGLVTLALF